MIGLTLDTGALIALERRDRRMQQLWATVVVRGHRITVPSPVLVEWWAARTRERERIVGALIVEPLSARVAQIAGEALAAVGRGPSVVDAIVMASAAQRGDVVVTGDHDDLDRLRAIFPSVRLLGV